MIDEIYDKNFFLMLEKFRNDYEHVAEWIGKYTKGSIGDIGCGQGFIIEYIQKHYLRTVWGIDGSRHAISAANDRVRPFIKCVDLTSKFIINQCNTAICIEVAEHIDDSFSKRLVDLITRTESTTIFFTAAVPGQQGVNHINLQPHQYWVDIFNKYGYRLNEGMTSVYKNELRDEIKIAGWLINNMMIFKK